MSAKQSKYKMMDDKSNKLGFKTPNGYLESMEQQLLDRLNEIDIPQEHGLSVPKNYFENLEDRFVSLAIDKKPIRKVVPLYARNWVPFISGIAACLVAGFFIWELYTYDSEILAATEISAYIENGTLLVGSQDLAQLLTEEDIDELALETTFTTDENLENYLLDNIDESNLFQE